jgi:hypothetical protein
MSGPEITRSVYHFISELVIWLLFCPNGLLPFDYQSRNRAEYRPFEFGTLFLCQNTGLVRYSDFHCITYNDKNCYLSAFFANPFPLLNKRVTLKWSHRRMRSGNFFLQLLQSRFTLIRSLTFFDFATGRTPSIIFPVRQFFALRFFRTFKGRSSSSSMLKSSSCLIHWSPEKSSHYFQDLRRN